MLGQMMKLPLAIPSLIRHADRWHGDTEIVTRLTEGGIHRQDWHGTHVRARRLASSLAKLGVAAGQRVGTLAWNNHRHLEIYYAVSGSGWVCHTINPRLFPDQVAWIVNDAEDQYVFFDLTFLKLVEAIAPKCPKVRGWVALTDRARMPASALPLLCCEELVASGSESFDWPDIDEDTASSLCYTSGTTGNPKGALYSHRSTLLHSFAVCMPDSFGLASREVVLPVVPMFHVNAWGIPYAAAMAGVKLVLPGPNLDGASLFELFEAEKVTLSAGVPTVWLALLQHMEKNNLRPSTLKRVIIGGAAAPPSMIRAFRERHGVEVVHAWGMTELSPLGTLNTFKSKHDAWDDAARDALREKQGRPLFGIDLRIVGGDGKPLPHDGAAFGDLEVRGHWVIERYFNNAGGDVLHDGWFPTGDVSTIDPDGYMKITDRSKDVIKSGGEWISSIDIECLAMAHPEVAEAAVIGVKHPKWDERPVLVVVRKPGTALTREAMLKSLEGKIAKWWMPDDVIFVESLPHTATGKLSKLELRKQLADYRLPVNA
ncbi:MAG TPA: 3-(methylthio)propionyl-CoA ligase [Usitatibacter sp.]|nr:3-(methylthio)propionyl-CoA ligase [Usitatibacter sp.]